MTNTLKYELVKTDIKEFEGKTLYRIRSLKDFSDVVDGDLGGYIESDANLSHEDDCWVYGNALVFGNARVAGNAWVYGYASVSGTAWVTDEASVYGNACIYGNASVLGNARVFNNAKVSGTIILSTGSTSEANES